MSLKKLPHYHSPDRLTEMLQRVRRALSEFDRLIQRAHQLGDEPVYPDHFFTPHSPLKK